MIDRVFLIVLDSLGIGALPDAAAYGDRGSNTLASLMTSEKLSIENLTKLGLLNINADEKGVDTPLAAYAKMSEKSNGKDTIIGHWEMCGVVSERDMPTYPNGFPKEIIEEFERRTGRGTLCNLPYSGTKVIADYGKEHMETGNLIVYTSADSVFQIAAHESVVPVDELYRCCEIARELLLGEHGVGRVIARPFEGEHPFTRTSRRHDYAILPPHDTTLDLVKNAGYETVCIGKISDIFAGHGVTKQIKTSGNTDGMVKALAVVKNDFKGFCFINLVDFDSVYGHRRDIDGYAKALSEFDAWLPEFMGAMRENDVLIITGDHGCDPGFKGTDHTREYTPLLVYGRQIMPIGLGVRESFADIGASICEMLGIENTLYGKSFFKELSMTKERLCELAKGAMKNAYAPYSHCKVGAALLAKSGKVYLGCNIENASFSPTICAERSAFASAVSAGEREFCAIAVCGGKEGVIEEPFYPCGVCRQVMREFCSDDFPVYVIKNDGIISLTLKDLLPHSFSNEVM